MQAVFMILLGLVPRKLDTTILGLIMSYGTKKIIPGIHLVSGNTALIPV